MPDSTASVGVHRLIVHGIPFEPTTRLFLFMRTGQERSSPGSCATARSVAAAHHARDERQEDAGTIHVEMQLITTFLAAIRRDEDGQGLAEYALILALIAIVAIVALIFLGGQVSTILSKVGSSV